MLPDGCTPYIVMELLKGESLEDRLRREQRLSVQDAVEIACQTASALAAAHERKIIHRDLKPGNLFLVADPTMLPLCARVKVLDFGIAKFFDDSSDASVETKPGTLLGTPRYMSPEQCRGVSIDHRADIYALGIILYEMVCGSPPFRAAAHGDLLTMHIGAAPKPPREWNEDIPRAVEAVILRALAKQPGERFSSMGEFGSALRSAERPATVTIPGHEEHTPTSILTPEKSQPETATKPVARSVHAPHTTISGSTGQITDAEDGKPRRSWLGMATMMAVVAAIAAIVVGLTLRQTTRAPTSPTVQLPVAQVPASPVTTPDAAVVRTPPLPLAVPQPVPEPAARVPKPAARPAASPATHSARKLPKGKAAIPSAPATNPTPPPKKSEAILDL
jgi:serine/threonine-protein kinase